MTTLQSTGTRTPTWLAGTLALPAVRATLLATLVATPLAMLLVTLSPVTSDAGCNVIPRTPGTFRGALGLTNRPFAGPGESLEIAVRNDQCAESPAERSTGIPRGFTPGHPGRYVASVIFGTPDSRTTDANVVVITSSCRALSAQIASCEQSPGIAAVTCIDANRTAGPRDLALVDRQGERRLLLRFPDTDALVDAPHDGRTLAGPATIAVTTAGAALPCSLAHTRCADAARLPGLLACVDEFYSTESSCGTAAGDRSRSFAHFTALPPVNDYRTILGTPLGVPLSKPAGDTEIRFTLDAAGNALVPVDWRGALIEKTSGGLARQLRGVRTIEAFLGLAASTNTVAPEAITSYDLRGETLPPMYRPGSPAYQETLFGTTDVPRTIVRIRGGTCCAKDVPCAGSPCPPLFDPAARVRDGGPFVIPSPARADERQRQACLLPDDPTPPVSEVSS